MPNLHPYSVAPRPCARALAALAILAGVFAAWHADEAGARTLRPAADAYVGAQSPDRNFGRARRLRVDSAPKTTSYLRFDLGATAASGRAVLRLYSLSNSRKGVLVRLAKTEWNERTVNFRAAPPGTAEVVRSGRIRKRRWTSINITPLLGEATASVVNLAITAHSPHAVVFASRESRRRSPRLVLGGRARKPAQGGLRVAAVGDIHPPSQSSNSAATAQEAAKADIILGLGDYQYPSGSLSDFNKYFDKDWGANLPKMYPVLAPNHDQYWQGGDPLNYFLGRGALGLKVPIALTPMTPYSFDKAGWHFVALPDACFRVSGCNDGSIGSWLERDLTAHPAKCTIAYWHQPYFTSTTSGHPPFEDIKPWLDILAAHHVDVILTGHNHDYERFAPQDVARKADPKGMQAFVVGTGGIGFYKFRNTAPNSAARNDNTYGVLQLALAANSYSWEFVPVGGGTFRDSGSMSCR